MIEDTRTFVDQELVRLRERVADLSLRLYQMGQLAKDELNYEIEDLEGMAARRRPRMPDQSGEVKS